VEDTAEIVGTDNDHCGPQFCWWIREKGPLGEAEVGTADGRQASVEPCLRAQPGDGVLGVIRLPYEWLEGIRGAEGPSDALNKDVISGPGEQSSIDSTIRERSSVRTTYQDRPGSPGGLRGVVVGEQMEPIPSRHLDCLLHAISAIASGDAQDSPGD
jgi:hypothetical protein